MISIIVGTSENGVIGHLNDIPWYLPRDLKHFKEITSGHTTIMGRKTYDSIIKRIGKPLPNRKNVIITRQKDFMAPDCVVVHSWEEAMETTKDEEVFVSGGSDIYSLALPYAQKIYLTIIHTQVDGDSFFTFDNESWKEISHEFHPKDAKNPFDCTFINYERK
jgi:dihydrofolate reductase